MGFYESRTPRQIVRQLKQGDIVAAVPFLAIDLKATQILPPEADEPILIDLTSVTQIGFGTQILSAIVLSPGIILNQSCDLAGEPGREKPILIARVVPCEERIKEFTATGDLRKVIGVIRTLANPGRHPSLFYLPDFQHAEFQLVRSVVDLLEVTCFPPSNLGALRKLVRLRLGPAALQALQERLAYCFGRFGAPDDLYYSEVERVEVRRQEEARRLSRPR